MKLTRKDIPWIVGAVLIGAYILMCGGWRP